MSLFSFEKELRHKEEKLKGVLDLEEKGQDPFRLHCFTGIDFTACLARQLVWIPAPFLGPLFAFQ